MLEEVKSTYNVCLTPQHYVFSLCDICPTDVKHLYAAFLVIIYYSFSSLFVFLSKKRLVQDGLVVKALDYQSRGPVFKTTGWLLDSAFHPSEVDKMSTRKFWELNGKK